MTESVLFTGLIFACTGASVTGFVSWASKDAKWLRRIAEWLGVGCFVLALVTWLLRWRLAGHLPIFGTYESALSLAVATLAAAVVARRTRGVWPVACAVAAALLAHGNLYDDTPFPLTISERSWIVEIHAILAWGAFGCLTTNAGAAVTRLLTGKVSEGADRLLSLTLSIGFVLHSAMLATGSFYKFLLFGQAWSFDPIETLGFVAWVSYGTLLHLHLMASWEGDRLARWCLLVFAVLVISYRFIVYFPAWSTYHIFDMDLRLHIDPSQSSAQPGGGS
jgi:ABC-type uncharacterized transport system permease subunit